MAFDHHLHHRRTALARYQLLQQVPALRDRELVTSHSYERAFRLHLQAALPENARHDRCDCRCCFDGGGPQRVPTPVVTRPDAVPVVELRSRLKGELAALAETFRRELYGSGSDGDRPPAVIVTVFESGANKQDILEAINRAIP
ncbi:hypothetical protein ACTAQJ_05765 [Arthrobacter sp. alpha11c]